MRNSLVISDRSYSVGLLLAAPPAFPGYPPGIPGLEPCDDSEVRHVGRSCLMWFGQHIWWEYLLRKNIDSGGGTHGFAYRVRNGGNTMDISYIDLVEAEREGQMAVCVKVAESIRALQTEGFTSIHEALEAAARIVESIGHSASTDAP